MYADSLIARARRNDPRLTDEEVLAVGYLEQLRLGLGSPFRLVERATTDTRLRPSNRVSIGQALLGRIGRGESYMAATAVGDAVGAPGGSWLASTRGLDERLIGRVIAAARDPWTGELAVRIAYTLAAAAGAAGDSALSHAAEAAALWRDRALASADVRRLRNSARLAGTPAVALVSRWRSARRFAVEVPPLARESDASEGEAIALGLAFADSVMARTSSMATTTWERTDAPLVGRVVAARWAALARKRRAPPRSPVIVDLRTARLLVLRGDDTRGRRARETFLRNATDEESLAAEHAVALWVGGADPGMARAVRRAAVSLRAYAQDPVLPVDASPDIVAQVRERYELRALTFDADVPRSWRPHYALLLDGALTDLRRVVPAMSVRGLRVHVGRAPLGALVLAVHEPKARRLYLPPATASGALAHELGHDLDWTTIQRGDYGTDQSIRRGEQRLSAVLARLTSDSLVVPGPDNDYHVNQANRPTEVFARGFDWFVASVLATWGWSNGHLSGAQDALFIGPARAARPDWKGISATALVDLMSEMTTIPPWISRAFLDRYGPARVPGAWDAMLGVLDEPAPTVERIAREMDDPQRFSEWATVPFGELTAELLSDYTCEPRDAEDGSPMGRARAAARATASARAHGIVARWARAPSPAQSLWPALAGGPWHPRFRAQLEALVCERLLTRWLDDVNAVLLIGTDG